MIRGKFLRVHGKVPADPAPPTTAGSMAKGAVAKPRNRHERRMAARIAAARDKGRE